MTALGNRAEHQQDGTFEIRLRQLEHDRDRDQELIAELQARLVESDMAYRHLEGAIASSRRIGAAIGIVMSVLKNTEEQAFGVLVTLSQRQNRKLRTVADDIVLTGAF